MIVRVLMHAAEMGRRAAWRVGQVAASHRVLAERLLYSLAYVGVPVAVITATGGLRTIEFWLWALFYVPIALLGAGSVAIPAVFIALPLVWVVDKLVGDKLGYKKLLIAGWLVLAGAAYILGFDPELATGVRLPTPWPGVGALLVLGLAGAVSFGLTSLTLCIPFPMTAGISNPASTRPTELDPGPDQEYWSDQMLEGWRAWEWRDGQLHGVFNPWTASEMVAACDVCEHPPAWGHSCGIYALKHLSGLDLFPSGRIVGKVQMWGNVIEHELGYRASHARITDLWADSIWMALQIRAYYPDVNVSVGTPLAKEAVEPWQT